MSKNQTPTAEKPQTAEQNAGLSRKKRDALVTYLAALFAIAFLFVALSMIIENHNLKADNENFSNSSATALERAEALQNENRELLSKAEDTRTAYDLLMQAQEADRKRKTEDFEDAMIQLAPLTENLSEEGLAIYQKLAAKLPQPETTQEETTQP